MTKIKNTPPQYGHMRHLPVLLCQRTVLRAVDGADARLCRGLRRVGEDKGKE